MAKKPIQPQYTAHNILNLGAGILDARARQRGQEEERSMEKIVATFNALTGNELTTIDGWQFMVVLKLVRAMSGTPQPDDFVDAANYIALAGEEALKVGCK